MAYDFVSVFSFLIVRDAVSSHKVAIARTSAGAAVASVKEALAEKNVRAGPLQLCPCWHLKVATRPEEASR